MVPRFGAQGPEKAGFVVIFKMPVFEPLASPVHFNGSGAVAGDLNDPSLAFASAAVEF